MALAFLFSSSVMALRVSPAENVLILLMAATGLSLDLTPNFNALFSIVLLSSAGTF